MAYLLIMSLHARGGRHVVFGVDPVGVDSQVVG